jgi:hypothetical protein
MIFEMRTYRFAPGQAREYLETYEKMALDLQIKHQKNLVGFWQSDVGPLNRTVNMWAYDSYEARDAAKAALAAEPGWRNYLQAAQPLIQEQESCILKPAPFFHFKP